MKKGTFFLQNIKTNKILPQTVVDKKNENVPGLRNRNSSSILSQFPDCHNKKSHYSH